MTDYTLQRDANRCHLLLLGNLTASTIAPLRAALKSELERGADEVIFDLGKTAMVDSSGIGLLIATHNSLARKEGKVRVIQVAEDILNMLQSMRLVARLNVSGRAA